MGKAKTGRPGKYREEMADQAYRLCRDFGATEKQLATFFGVNPDTIASWKLRFEEFSESIKRARVEFDNNRVERSLIERALGYEYVEEIIEPDAEGKLRLKRKIKKHQPSDVTALIFWLKNRQPERWRDIKGVNLGGKLDHGVADIGNEIERRLQRAANFNPEGGAAGEENGSD